MCTSGRVEAMRGRIPLSLASASLSVLPYLLSVFTIIATSLVFPMSMTSSSILRSLLSVFIAMFTDPGEFKSIFSKSVVVMRMIFI